MSSEIVRKWPIVVACSIGIGVGIMALPYSTAGLFIGPLESEFQWSRSAISFGPTLMLGIVALLSPLSGWLADRYSPLLIISISLSAVAACFFMLSNLSQEISSFYVICSIMAVTGAGASTVVFARIVCASFWEQRGLALGLVMAGNGVTAIVSPITIGPIVLNSGWRQGYFTIGMVIVLAIPIILLLLRSREVKKSTIVENSGDGFLFLQAISSVSFWLLGIAFFLGTFATTGMVIHLIPYLTDIGITPQKAVSFASFIGFGLIFGRILTGWLMDRFSANYVGAIMMFLSALGLGLLGTGETRYAAVGALAIGFCIGAELDIIGYLYWRLDHGCMHARAQRLSFGDTAT